MKKLLFILPICLFTLFSCNQKEDELVKVIKTISKSENSSGEFIIIGYQSCLSCVDEAERYMLDKLTDSNNKTKFILTSYSSAKELKIQFKNHMNNERLIMDDSNDLYPFGQRVEYPLYIEIENNKIIREIVLDTDNSPFVVL